MNAVLNPTDLASLPAPAAIQQLHHYAYKARDAEETRQFYEDILGLPLYHIIQSDYVPSTGEYCPYTHFFFRLQDGSFIAFFDLGDDVKAEPSPNTPLWVNHIAFRVNTVQELENTKQRLEAHGVEVLGVTDHHIFKSIYFFDPNGIRLELSAQLANDEQMEKTAPWPTPACASGQPARSNGARNAPKARWMRRSSPSKTTGRSLCANKPTCPPPRIAPRARDLGGLWAGLGCMPSLWRCRTPGSTGLAALDGVRDPVKRPCHRLAWNFFDPTALKRCILLPQ